MRHSRDLLHELPPVEGRGWPLDEAAVPAAAGETPWPRITVVIPSFNQACFLEETLRSILLQAYPDLELMVLDGGSRDGSVEILERYSPWLAHWTSGPDGGQSDAINRGFARATGDLVTFFSSDDVYEPGAFFDAARLFLEQPEAGVTVGAFRYMDERSRRREPLHPPRLPGPGPHDLALVDPRAWRLHQVSTFYSRRALDAVGRRVREELDYTMDRELLYRVCRRFPAALSERHWSSFRLHETSKSVASILPMSREMADLHLLDAAPDEPAARRRRRRALARYRRARGHLKLARSGVRRSAAALSLLRALFYQPSSLFERRYLVDWLEVCGLARPARRLAASYASLKNRVPM